MSLNDQNHNASLSDSADAQSRRHFLRDQLTTTAALAAGMSITASGTLHGAEESDSTSPSADRPLRIGLVGSGGRGTGAVNDTMTINDGVQLVAAADLEMQKCVGRCKMLKKKHGDKIAVPESKMYAGLDAYKRILDDPDIDIVFLTTSPGFRPRHIAEAVDAGKHIFAEKPACVDPAGYRICLDAHEKAASQGTAIVTGTQYRRQTNYVAAIEQIQQGAIGEIVSATSRYCSDGIWYRNRKDGMSDLDYQLKNWMHFVWLSGDQIVEQAVHNIDAMNWIMGSAPQSAFASGGRFTRPDDSELWDNMSVDFAYPGDRTLSFKCRQIPGATTDVGNVIYGSEGTMHLGASNKGTTIFDRKGKEIWSKDGSISDAYMQEHKDLVDSIRAGKPIVELKQTADSSLTAVMGRMAAYTGQKVEWDFVAKESKLNLFPENLTATSEAHSDGYAIPGKTKLI